MVLFVIGMSVLAAAALPSYAALAACAALALRYIAEIALGPVGTGAALRSASGTTLLSVSTAVGLVAIGLGALWIGALLVVCLGGLIQAIPGPVVALGNPGRERMPALAALATWRDLGAGTGPMLAGALLPLVSHPALYGGAALCLRLLLRPLPACGSGGQRERVEKPNQSRSRPARDESAEMGARAGS